MSEACMCPLHRLYTSPAHSDSCHMFDNSCHMFDNSCHMSDHDWVEHGFSALASLPASKAACSIPCDAFFVMFEKGLRPPFSAMHCQVTFEPLDCFSPSSLEVVCSGFALTEFALHPPGTPRSCWHTPPTTPSETPLMPASLQSSMPSTRRRSITAGQSRRRGTCWGQGLAASWWGTDKTPQPTLWTR